MKPNKRQTFYEKTNEKEFKTLKELMKKIEKGYFSVVNIHLQKNMVGSDYRVVMFLHPTEE